MPTTRSGAKSTPMSNSQDTRSSNELLQKPEARSKNGVRLKKRKADAIDSRCGDKENQDPELLPSDQKRPKADERATQEKSSMKDADVQQSIENDAQKRRKGPDGRPIVLRSDLEFDFDRTQLRDPRPTPGRRARPRYTSYDLEGRHKELKESLETTYHIPVVEKPKGRLNAFQKDENFRANGLVNPMHSFHDLYVCHKKGRGGSPTYDEAGFQLDYEKVDNWMAPKPYNKKKMVKGMDRALSTKQTEAEQMFQAFFKNGKCAEHETTVMGYVKDRISKDLGIPWHQIGPDQARAWRGRGFKPVEFEKWWKEPNEVEHARQLNMLMGASLRKNLEEGS